MQKVCVALLALGFALTACNRADTVAGPSAVEESAPLAKKKDGEDAGKVRVCHFAGKGKVNLLEVSENALPAHLGHGDSEAGFWVHEVSDCLLPPPPPDEPDCYGWDGIMCPA